jgi:hypothetical protein
MTSIPSRMPAGRMEHEALRRLYNVYEPLRIRMLTCTDNAVRQIIDMAGRPGRGQTTESSPEYRLKATIYFLNADRPETARPGGQPWPSPPAAERPSRRSLGTRGQPFPRHRRTRHGAADGEASRVERTARSERSGPTRPPQFD